MSQKTLTIATYPTDEVWALANAPQHHSALVQHLAQLPVQRVLLESSGGYEKPVVYALQQAGIPVVVVPAQRARYFAKSMRGDLKTDRADARMLAYFAYCYPVPPLRRARLCKPNSRSCGRVGSRWCRSWSGRRSVCRPCSLRRCGRRGSR